MEIWKQDTSKLKGTTLNMVTKALIEYWGAIREEKMGTASI